MPRRTPRTPAAALRICHPPVWGRLPTNETGGESAFPDRLQGSGRLAGTQRNKLRRTVRRRRHADAARPRRPRRGDQARRRRRRATQHKGQRGEDREQCTRRSAHVVAAGRAKRRGRPHRRGDRLAPRDRPRRVALGTRLGDRGDATGAQRRPQRGVRHRTAAGLCHRARVRDQGECRAAGAEAWGHAD